MSLSTSYSWFPVGERFRVAYEAPQGRRINAIGGYFSHGPLAGCFEYVTYASVPKSSAKSPRKSVEEVAAAHGLKPEALGPIDAERFLAFVWHLAGRPQVYPDHWRRERPLMIVLDNYSVHKSQPVQDALAQLEAADVYLVYLPSYCPELSEIEPIWHSVKGHGMPYRSQAVLGDMKRAVEDALADKARQLRDDQAKTTNLQRLAA